MNYQNYKPSSVLQPYIDRYWLCDSDSNNDLFPLFAGTGIDLFIHFASSFCANGKALAASHTFCPRHPIEISTTNGLNYLAIRFRSGSFRHFCSIPFNELNNNHLSLSDIWGKEGEDLFDKLQEQTDAPSKIELLDNFFSKQLESHHKKTLILYYSISYIYNHYEEASIYSIAKDLNISLRHFERLFKNEFDISPKKFQTISRFQSTMKELLFSTEEDYLEISLKNGYYDQSHFIKECKLLSSTLPLDILKRRNQNTHFYFKSLTTIL